METVTDDIVVKTVEPVAVQVTRYKCPYCNRSRSRRKAAIDHMAKCWQNPITRGCRTCVFFKPSIGWKPGYHTKPIGFEWCAAGYNIRPGLVTNCKKWKKIET